MKCPKCHKTMIQRDNGCIYSYLYLTIPPKTEWRWWCGGCDHYEKGGVRVEKTVEEIYMEKWEKVNEVEE